MKNLSFLNVLFLALAIFGISSCGSDDTTINDNIAKHAIVKEKVLFSRWRTLTSRLVRFPNGHEVDFDVRS